MPTKITPYLKAILGKESVNFSSVVKRLYRELSTAPHEQSITPHLFFLFMSDAREHFNKYQRQYKAGDPWREYQKYYFIRIILLITRFSIVKNGVESHAAKGLAQLGAHAQEWCHWFTVYNQVTRRKKPSYRFVAPEVIFWVRCWELAVYNRPYFTVSKESPAIQVLQVVSYIKSNLEICLSNPENLLELVSGSIKRQDADHGFLFAKSIARQVLLQFSALISPKYKVGAYPIHISCAAYLLAIQSLEWCDLLCETGDKPLSDYKKRIRDFVESPMRKAGFEKIIASTDEELRFRHRLFQQGGCFSRESLWDVSVINWCSSKCHP